MGDTTVKTKRPLASAFKQQQLKAWQPLLTPGPVITVFIIVGIIFIPIGAAMLVASNSVKENYVRYDNQCTIGESCTVYIDVPSKMEAPVYLYYKLENFYQNHRRYVKSRSDVQLKGDLITSKGSISECDPKVSEDGSDDPEKMYLPCGLIAFSKYNDTIALLDDNTTIPFTKDGIAWGSDLDKKFGNPPEDAPGIPPPSYPKDWDKNFTDPDFVVWMRIAALPTFRKLYGIINQDIPEGTYALHIQNNFPVDSFDGTKTVILSTTSWLGGKNPFLGIAFLVVGSLCFVQGVLFFVKHKISPRELGDTKYLDWNR